MPVHLLPRPFIRRRQRSVGVGGAPSTAWGGSMSIPPAPRSLASHPPASGPPARLPFWYGVLKRAEHRAGDRGGLRESRRGRPGCPHSGQQQAGAAPAAETGLGRSRAVCGAGPARLGCRQQCSTVPLNSLHAPQFNLEVPEVEPAATTALERWRREAGLPLVLEVRPGGRWRAEQAVARALALLPPPLPTPAARCPPCPRSCPCRSSCSRGVLRRVPAPVGSRTEVRGGRAPGGREPRPAHVAAVGTGRPHAAPLVLLRRTPSTCPPARSGDAAGALGGALLPAAAGGGGRRAAPVALPACAPLTLNCVQVREGAAVATETNTWLLDDDVCPAA